MTKPDPELQHSKNGVAILAACLVQTIAEVDVTFQDRFLARLEAAYLALRDNTDGDVRNELELLTWTQTLLTGFSHVSGQGKPFLSD